MKTITAFALACCLASVPASARAEEPERTTYVTLEQQTVLVRTLHGPLGLYTFFYVDRAYAEAVVGPSFSPTAWLTVALGAGVEQAEEGSWRVGGLLWMGRARWTSVTLLETGASGFWGRTEFAWRPAPWAGIGVLGDLGLGVGPRLELRVPSLPVQIWGASLYDWKEERPAAAFGVRLDL